MPISPVGPSPFRFVWVIRANGHTVVVTPLILWGAAESGVTIMAASIPVLRTLFRDLNTISRRYYISESKSATQNSRVATTKHVDTNTVVISAGPAPDRTNKSSSSIERCPLRDSQGQILQSTEVVVAVEYRKEEEEADFHRLPTL